MSATSLVSEPLFEIADLSELWLELHAFGADAARLTRWADSAARRRCRAANAVETTLQRVLPLASATSQTVVARALLPNADGEWRPGMAVQRRRHRWPSVRFRSRSRRPGLQRFRDFTVVFAQVGRHLRGAHARTR